MTGNENLTTTIDLVSRSADETMQIAARLAAMLHPGNVLTLSGPLGAGKTCFVRGLAVGLGINPRQVSSPTFVLVQEYQSGDPGTIRTIYHIDAYRLTGNTDDLSSIDWEEMINADDAVIAVEWPDRLGEGASLPQDRLCEVELAHDESDDGTRHLRLVLHGRLAQMSRELLTGSEQQQQPQNHSDPRRPCPTCKRKVAPDVPTFPFCSDRCRWADLGKWMEGDYRLSRDVTDDDELDE